MAQIIYPEPLFDPSDSQPELPRVHSQHDLLGLMMLLIQGKSVLEHLEDKAGRVATGPSNISANFVKSLRVSDKSNV